MSSLGQFIKTLRLEKGMSLKQLAEELNGSATTVFLTERDRTILREKAFRELQRVFSEHTAALRARYCLHIAKKACTDRGVGDIWELMENKIRLSYLERS